MVRDTRHVTPGVTNTVRLAERYDALIRQLGEEVGTKRGWIAHVARRLGVSPSYVSMIVNGTRAGVGVEAIESAIARLGLKREFFYGTGAISHYRNYLKNAAEKYPTPRATRTAAVADRAHTPPAAFLKFAQSPTGKTMTPAEHELLSRLRFSERDLLPLAYEFFLAGLRHGSRPGE